MQNNLYNNHQTYGSAALPLAIIALICRVIYIISRYFLFSFYHDGYGNSDYELFSLSHPNAFETLCIILLLASFVLLVAFAADVGGASLLSACLLTFAANTAVIYIRLVINCAFDEFLRFDFNIYDAFEVIIAISFATAGILLLVKPYNKALIFYPMIISLILSAIKLLYIFSQYNLSSKLVSTWHSFITSLSDNSSLVLMCICIIIISLKFRSLEAVPKAQEAYAATPEQRLNNLDKLLQSGTITQEEYDAKRKEIISKL